MINMADEQTISREFVEREFASILQMYNLGIEKLKEEQMEVMVAVLMPFLKEKVGPNYFIIDANVCRGHIDPNSSRYYETH